MIVQCLYCTFRAKFAEWKGKTLKRPATFSRNPKPAPWPKTGPKATIGAQSEPVVQSEAVKPTAALKTDDQTNDIEVPDNKTVCSRRSSNIMNTTLDLQNISDMDLPVDPEIKMESVRTIRVLILKPIDWQTDRYLCIDFFFIFYFFIYIVISALYAIHSWCWSCVINWRQWRCPHHVKMVSLIQILYAGIAN